MLTLPQEHQQILQAARQVPISEDGARHFLAANGEFYSMSPTRNDGDAIVGFRVFRHSDSASIIIGGPQGVVPDIDAWAVVNATNNVAADADGSKHVILDGQSYSVRPTWDPNTRMAIGYTIDRAGDDQPIYVSADMR